jgi:acylphosphatase
MGDRLREVWYSGHVQGVGFRYTAWTIARGFAVTGFVENLADGRVHLVAEGPADQVDAFLSTLARRMSGQVRDMRGDQRPATGEYREFEIRS